MCLVFSELLDVISEKEDEGVFLSVTLWTGGRGDLQESEAIKCVSASN